MPPLQQHIADSLEKYKNSDLHKRICSVEIFSANHGFPPYVGQTIPELLEQSQLQLLEVIRGEIEKLHTEYPDLESDDFDNGNLNFKQQVLDLLTIKDK